jgi:hypothetical protein
VFRSTALWWCEDDDLVDDDDVDVDLVDFVDVVVFVDFAGALAGALAAGAGDAGVLSEPDGFVCAKAVAAIAVATAAATRMDDVRRMVLPPMRA